MRSPLKWRAVVVVVAVAVLCGAGAGAQTAIDQNQPSGPVDMAAFSQTDLAQSFQPGRPVSAGAGILLEAGYGSTDTVTIQLWTAAAIPLLGHSGLIVLGFLMLAAGVVALRRFA